MPKTNEHAPVFVVQAVHQCGDEEIKHLAHVSPTLDDAVYFIQQNQDYIVTRDTWFWAVTSMPVGVQVQELPHPWLYDTDGLELK
jgi:hypothetical protein